MKKLAILFATLLQLTTLQLANAAILTEWTFDTSQPGGFRSAGTWFTNIAAEVGSGTASAWHIGAANYSPFPGNGSYCSFGLTNGWAVGDFFQYATSSAGYQNIAISYDQAGSLSGPSTFFLEYSTNGSTFTKFESDYKVSVGHWTSSSARTTNSFSFDLSSVAAINDKSTVYFRIVDDSTVAIGGGTVTGYEDDRIDNFLVSAQLVPEPSMMALAVLGSAFCAYVLKRKSLKS